MPSLNHSERHSPQCQSKLPVITAQKGDLYSSLVLQSGSSRLRFCWLLASLRSFPLLPTHKDGTSLPSPCKTQRMPTSASLFPSHGELSLMEKNVQICINYQTILYLITIILAYMPLEQCCTHLLRPCTARN